MKGQFEMKTLNQMYRELISEVDEWSYYDNPPFLSIDTLYSPDQSFDFIKAYFKCGGKQSVFDDRHLQNSKDILERSPHIISTYLLGILITKAFRIDLHTYTEDTINFKYLWFLACLYHDVGYVYENTNCCKELKMTQTDGLDAIRNICNIQYLNNREFITYNKQYVNTYLIHRATCSNGKTGKLDHGIIGGLLLYDRLRKNFEKAWKQVCCENESKESFIYNGLHFSKKQYKYYEIAADAIISHNIWVDPLKEYLKSENEQNIEIRKIKSDNPIAFILALADTIEPIKKYGSFALDKIYYEEIKKGFKIYMPDTENSKMYKYISDIGNWIDVEVMESHQNTFSISKKEN